MAGEASSTIQRLLGVATAGVTAWRSASAPAAPAPVPSASPVSTPLPSSSTVPPPVVKTAFGDTVIGLPVMLGLAVVAFLIFRPKLG